MTPEAKRARVARKSDGVTGIRDNLQLFSPKKGPLDQPVVTWHVLAALGELWVSVRKCHAKVKR